jgi:hypothetical protein
VQSGCEVFAGVGYLPCKQGALRYASQRQSRQMIFRFAFLSGKADGGVTQSDIKQKQPDYFKYLVWLLEIDSDPAPSATPVASAD